MSEHTGDSYQDKAIQYAKNIDQKPMNIYFERPALISLLPELGQQNILDAGCGSGWLTEYMLAQGAKVTALDFNSDFVSLTQQRVQGKAEVLQANLAEPLPVLADATFDLITCPLVMHYLKDWLPVFKEFYRVLKPDGQLIFSTHHPIIDWQNFPVESYFSFELLEDEWDVGKVKFYRRPLSAMSQDLAEAGFFIERLLEPQPLEALKEIDAELFANLSKMPWRLMIRAGKRADEL